LVGIGYGVKELIVYIPTNIPTNIPTYIATNILSLFIYIEE
jgi:hypothetical protein